MKQKDQLNFSQQLLTLISSGLPLLNAIQLMNSCAPKQWQAWLRNIEERLKKGQSFSQSLQLSEKHVSIEFIHLIRVSERTGNIHLALKTICTQLEAQIELRHKLQQALSYPLVTLISSFLLVIVMMVWVVPVFKEVFEHFQADLPTPTKALIKLSWLIENYFIYIGGFLAIAISSITFAWIKLPYLQKKCDYISLFIPIIGQLFRLASLTYWCRTLGHLLQAGLPLPDALRLTAQSSNHWLSHDLSAEIFKRLTQGWSFGEAIKRADPKQKFFDLETLQLLQIASESGSLPYMLEQRAETMGAQLSNRLNTLSQSLEPFFIIFVGLIIGGLVIILYLPIFNLGQIV